MTIYRELKGIFKSIEDGEKRHFTKALGKGRVVWCERLDENAYEHHEDQFKSHFDQYHENLALPLEFIT